MTVTDRYDGANEEAEDAAREAREESLEEIESLQARVAALEAERDGLAARLELIGPAHQAVQVDRNALRLRAEKAESRSAALGEALRGLADDRCYDHADACCREWCSMCQDEVEAVASARAALASGTTGEGAPVSETRGCLSRTALGANCVHPLNHIGHCHFRFRGEEFDLVKNDGAHVIYVEGTDRLLAQLDTIRGCYEEARLQVESQAREIERVKDRLARVLRYAAIRSMLHRTREHYLGAIRSRVWSRRRSGGGGR
jgi:hypothetical protein